MLAFNPDLVDDLARQRVVLFLGSGVSSSAQTATGSKIKGWHDFLQSALDRVEPMELQDQVRDLLGKRDYLLASELLQQHLQEAWDTLVTDEFTQMAQPSALHEALIALDQRLIFTTNFDKLVESCWVSRIGASTHLSTVISRIDDSSFRILKDHSGKYLVKIHGTVDDPSTMIFSRSEYIRLAFGNVMYSSFLEVTLLTYTFLFVGFSMEDPAIASLMEMYALRFPKTRPHYIIVPAGMQANIKEIFKRLRRLQVIEYDPTSNHAKLAELISKLAEVVRARRKEILADTM